MMAQSAGGATTIAIREMLIYDRAALNLNKDTRVWNASVEFRDDELQLAWRPSVERIAVEEKISDLETPRKTEDTAFPWQ